MEGKIDEARKNGSIVLYDYAGGEISRFNFKTGGRRRRRSAASRQAVTTC